MNRDERNATAERNIDLVYKICLTRLYSVDKNSAEDAAQNVFMYYSKKNPVFKDAEHEKAWFIRCAVNICNDMCRAGKRRGNAELPELFDDSAAVADEYFTEENSILSLFSLLPPKICDTMYLYYAEEYSTEQIAKILGVTGFAVRTRLKRGRESLRKIYKEEYQTPEKEENYHV